jgi:hypothetical protein
MRFPSPFHPPSLLTRLLSIGQNLPAGGEGGDGLAVITPATSSSKGNDREAVKRLLPQEWKAGRFAEREQLTPKQVDTFHRK